MTARPGDWSLVADGGADPVPGDPDAVRTQASYYTGMAATIRAEAQRLKTLGQDGELVGKYKQSLQQELGDLSDEVDKAHGRYEAVGTALKPYAAALDNARAESWGALQDAVRAHGAQAAANGMPNPQSTDGKPLTDAQQADQSRRTSAINDANAALTRARTRLRTALTDLNNAGKRAAGAINDHTDDSLKDHHHWWDVVVKIIKVLVEIANYVVIAVAIISLFIPGLDVLGFLVLMSAAILLTDTILAATGNGSWLDVAVDVVGLLTCGIGGAAAKSGEMAAASAGRAGVKVAAREAADGAGMGLVQRTATYFGRRSAAKALVADLMESNGATKLTARLASGDSSMAEALNKLGALQDRFPNSAKIASRYAFAQRAAGVTRTSFYTGAALLGVNTVFSGSNVPGLEGRMPSPLAPFKEGTTTDGPHKVEEFTWSGAATTAFLAGTGAGGLMTGLVAAGAAEMHGG